MFLKKPRLTGRMLSSVVKLLEYNIQYNPRGSIKSHALANFLEEFSSPVMEEVTHTWIFL